uniref:EF-hand domain-containing protein n=1 Tax=Odontella aurita TaxID=265563 RepID=A0A7S4J1E0_9STRA|mmetsp:Transcript_35639/g.106350  ORF Transcript_35639/g.106350 Transcript_35639/m.106350 type:complete len:173 (+) Transcript_35639:119-637(+)
MSSENEGLGLNEAYKAEIRAAFNVFDTERSGVISPHSLKLLLRALGYRATRQVIKEELGNLNGGRRKHFRSRVREEEYDDQKSVVDIEAAYAVIAQKWASRDPSLELKMNFRLFTDTDHITVDNLRQVALELGHDAGGVGDDQIRAMIETFDADLDGKINLDEFRGIMIPSD